MSQSDEKCQDDVLNCLVLFTTQIYSVYKEMNRLPGLNTAKIQFAQHLVALGGFVLV